MHLLGNKIRDDLGKELRADVLANKYYNDIDAEWYLHGERIPIAKNNHPFAMRWPSQGQIFSYVYLSADMKFIRDALQRNLLWERWNMTFYRGIFYFKK